MDPGDFTLRELDWMATGRERAAWWHTSYLMALTANMNRDKKKKASPWRPAEFHPLEQRHRKPESIKLSPKESISVLKDLFIHKRIPDGTWE